VAAPIDLNLVRAFVIVHETGSFSAAANKLGVPRSTVSRAVSSLEEETGTLLFHRTTRKVTTTRAGISLFDRAQPWLERLEASLRDLPEATPAPSGILRVTSTVDLGSLIFAEAVARYTMRYPETSVEVSLTGRTVDLVKEGFDLALRHARGPVPGANYVTRKLGTVALQLFAAPDYLTRRGTPRTIADLHEHDIVTIGAAPIKLPGGKTLPGKTRIGSDDKAFARAVLRAGAGIGALPTYLVMDDVTNGHLVRVLPSLEVATGSLHIVMPSKKHVPNRVTAFRDLLVEMFRR
jgi:DNA-binding transcriptional LysR family regulator